MFKSNKKGVKIKEYLLQKFKNHPQNNYKKVKEEFVQIANQNDKEQIELRIDAIKMVIKTKSSAIVKFFVLLLLRDMMKSQNPIVVNYFIKKIMERLYKIMSPKTQIPINEYKQECLKHYLPKKQSTQQIKQDKLDQVKFYILLKECWDSWGDKYSSKYPKIKHAHIKLKPILRIKEKESYINYPDEYDESFEEYNDTEMHKEDIYQPSSNTPSKENIQRINTNEYSVQKEVKQITSQQMENRIVEIHNTILNMISLINEGMDDVELLLNMAFTIQSQEIEDPPFKEILKQVSQTDNSNIIKKAQNIAEFMKKLNQIMQDFDKKKISPDQLKKEIIDLSKSYDSDDDHNKTKQSYSGFDSNTRRDTLNQEDFKPQSFHEQDYQEDSFDGSHQESENYISQKPKGRKVSWGKIQQESQNPNIGEEFENNSKFNLNEEDEQDEKNFIKFENFNDNDDKEIGFSDFKSVEEKTSVSDFRKDKLSNKNELETINEEREESQSNFTQNKRQQSEVYFEYPQQKSVRNQIQISQTPLSRSQNTKVNFITKKKTVGTEPNEENLDFDLEDNKFDDVFDKQQVVRNQFTNFDQVSQSEPPKKYLSQTKGLSTSISQQENKFIQKEKNQFEEFTQPTSPKFNHFSTITQKKQTSIQEQGEQSYQSEKSDNDLQHQASVSYKEDPFPEGKFTFQNSKRNNEFTSIGKKIYENSQKIDHEIQHLEQASNTSSQENDEENISVSQKRSNYDIDHLERKLLKNN